MTGRWVDHFATGIHSARPSASAVPKGAFYSCTTHSLIYQSDGASTWSTWATLGSTGSGLVAVTEGTTPSSPGAGTQTLFLDSADHKLKRVNSSGTVVSIESAGGTAPVPYFAATSGAGDLNLGTASSYTDVTGLSVSVAAAVGDKILIAASVGSYNASGIDQDIAIVVAGTVKSALGAANQGVNVPTPTCVQWLHTVVSGDISGGNVAIKVQARAASGTTFIYNNATHGTTGTVSAVNYFH